MNEQPMDPMAGDPIGPQSPVPPVIPPDEGGMNMTKIYQIGLGILGFILLILLIFVFVYRSKANRTQKYIDGVVAQAVDKKDKEDKDYCAIEKKDIRENPWATYKAPDDFGAFTFTIPRNWSVYENFDMNANNPYTVYFNPDKVAYDSTLNSIHSALQVTISKKLYDQEIKEMKDKLKQSKAPTTEEQVKVSNFDATKFTYVDKDKGNKRVAAVLVPYRDRVLFIQTDDYDQWNQNYYDKFWKSFALTP